MNYYFPLHLNGDNRGCEGIAKGTAKMLNVNKDNLIALSSNIELDNRLGLSSSFSLKRIKHSMFEYIKYRLKRKFAFKQVDKVRLHYEYCYGEFLNSISVDGIVFSTGGDMFCYSDNEAVFTAEYCQKKGLKTILWGCSIGEKNMTPAKLRVIKHFHLIYARESLTYNYLRNLDVKKIVCIPDPAFVLEPEKVTLPNCFKSSNDVIGINISNYILGRNDKDNIIAIECFDMINYILQNTQLHILLVPHVLWNHQDDRIISKKILGHYSYISERFSMLNSEEMNYLNIRYVISKCRFFIGSRTHSVISAYSTCVPTLALGYSIKSIGIAKDLQLPEELVVKTQENNVKPGDFVRAIRFLFDNESIVRSKLHEIMPEYISRCEAIRSIINNITTVR